MAPFKEAERKGECGNERRIELFLSATHPKEKGWYLPRTSVP